MHASLFSKEQTNAASFNFRISSSVGTSPDLTSNLISATGGISFSLLAAATLTSEINKS